MAVAVTLVAGFVLPAPASADPADGSFERKRVDVNESALWVRLAVTRSATAALEPWSGWWSTEDRETDDVDYEHGGGLVQLGVGQTSGTINIQLYDDFEYERHESFRVRLFDGSGSREIDHALVTITDDDDTFSPDLDAEALEAEARAAEASSAPAPSAPVVSATGSGGVSSSSRPVVSNASRPAPRPAARPTGQSARGPRLTPFHLQGPSDEPASPTEAPPSAVTAAGVVGALALARVSAELWFRLRVASR
ncbi:MAG TPA: Calx-beta domain-containing protein [Acidimicrobiales bacterium]